MILHTIVAHKKKEIAALKKKTPLAQLKQAVSKLPKYKPGRFADALSSSKFVAVIAEIKKKSPSKGILRKDFKPLAIAADYQKAGASALSVLTDTKFFAGSSDILKKVAHSSSLPILRKDFTLDEYQIYEARLLGADAVLLIAAILSPAQMKKLSALAEKLGLDCLFEVHTKKDVAKILPLKPKLIGINNRDLKTFHVDIQCTKNLISLLPKQALVVSESGIQKHEDLVYLKSLGVSAVLVGESLMRQKDIPKALKALLEGQS